MMKPIAITLEENDWGQIIDGLTYRAEQYELTAECHEGGSVDGEILEVRDAAEARELARCYHQLVEQIRGQLGAVKNEMG